MRFNFFKNGNRSGFRTRRWWCLSGSLSVYNIWVHFAVPNFISLSNVPHARSSTIFNHSRRMADDQTRNFKRFLTLGIEKLKSGQKVFYNIWIFKFVSILLFRGQKFLGVILSFLGWNFWGYLFFCSGIKKTFSGYIGEFLIL